ncbi:TetR/AcrR family transcriptional regulator [Frondihabitans australicus]|uniref:TetR/AcrR family transcriptional regulator n=1 Tax=Frondihabitans australicus TaxID=386892 RepID=UPI001FED16A6|nr:TetR/AcrR family transcriptional regulator [Frondihabitans australicus]
MKTSMRDRLVEAASELFYAEGIRAVSVDRIIEAAGTTKVTFYRHFASKDDLVLAHLEKRAQLERDGIGQALAVADGDADRFFELVAGNLGVLACEPGFRGCPFINAAAEFPDGESPIRRFIDAHRTWWLDALGQSVSGRVAEADREGTARDLMLLRDGAMVAGYLGDGATLAASFLRSARALIA